MNAFSFLARFQSRILPVKAHPASCAKVRLGRGFEANHYHNILPCIFLIFEIMYVLNTRNGENWSRSLVRQVSNESGKTSLKSDIFRQLGNCVEQTPRYESDDINISEEYKTINLPENIIIAHRTVCIPYIPIKCAGPVRRETQSACIKPVNNARLLIFYAVNQKSVQHFPSQQTQR